MNCHDFEARLEALAARDGDRLSDFERAACLRHAGGCAECGELLELAQMTAESVTGPAGRERGGNELLAAVLASTSGPACDRALERLAARAEGDELLALHLESCRDCRALAGVMTALAADLPGLAEVRPDAAFVDDVLARSLPTAVRLRRWWRRTRTEVLPRWVRRPRFAWEAAFVLTVVCLPVIVSSGPTLAAAPARALELAHEAPRVDLRGLDDEVEGRLDRSLRGIRESEAAGWAERSLDGLRESFREAEGGLAHGYGTLHDLVASFLSKDGEDASSPDSNDTAPAPNGPVSEETTK